MRVITVRDNNNSRKHALLIPNNEWTRLKKVLTKKDDERATVELTKRLREERKATSNAITESWDATVTNQRKKEFENKQELIAINEAKQQQKDEIMLHEILKRRNAIVEKARLQKWSDRDSIKAITRAVHKIEVLRERDIQIEFNKAEKAKELEANRLLKIKQNLDAEQYKRDRWEQKLKQAETKKVNAINFQKELKERENKKRDDDIKLKEEGKSELQRIANEIKEDNENKKAKTLAVRKNVINQLNENRKLVTEKMKRRQSQDKEENLQISIMAEAKKKLAKKIKLKELEILKRRQTSEKKFETENKNLDRKDVEFQKAIEEKEQKYQKEELIKKHLIKKRKKDFEDYKKILDEQIEKEKNRLTLSQKWEMERCLRETEALRSLDESRRQEKAREMNSFRKNLYLQCENNRAATRANKQVDLEQYNAHLNLLQQQDEELMTYRNNMIAKYQKAGISVIPK
ncbi:LOW QUALITY PROTEIN: coiled-coil domain-containing protein 173-like [Melanaphis sacchari]|uniref:LOW QUALITY PROTEIN: coiled-coil domain-containing protein 173-like n=1 Tax=Melanaphis sacchari TaxID=742174 RepID=UPI000DC15635|nr:LOW QUALITY PROTEIN: coiled-coil domain-containing protein 173-like [Melanaphis sacchari]